MSQQRSKGKHDPFLWDDFDAATDAESEKTTQLLLRAEHLITAIVGRLGWGNRDREDYRQDVLLSLLSKIRRSKVNPSAAPIQKYDAYVAQSSFNVSKRKHPTTIDDEPTSLDEDNRIGETLADAHPSQAEILAMGETVRNAWRACTALMTRDQLALFLFDKNDILWQLVCLSDPISLDEIADALEITVVELQEIMEQLPCKNDQDLAVLMGFNERKIHNLRHRMKPLLKTVQRRCGYFGRNGAGEAD